MASDPTFMQLPITLSGANLKHLAPTYHALPRGADQMSLVVPTQVKRALAILTPEDALLLLRVEADRLVPTLVARDYVVDVSGGELTPVEPALLPGACAYLQSRRLVTYDFPAQTHRCCRVTAGLEEIAISARWVSLAPEVIVVQVEDTQHYDAGGRLDVRLRSYELSGEQAIPRGVLELDRNTGKDMGWGAGRGLVAAFRAGRFEFFDANLSTPLGHPLTHPMNKLLSEGRTLQGIQLHPRHALAMFTLQERGVGGMSTSSLWWATWKNPEPARLQQLVRIPLAETMRLGTFSPSADWINFSTEQAGKTHFYVQHVLEPLRAPFSLGSSRAPLAEGWLQEPLAYVVIDEELGSLACWELSHL
jgi:hypothetical protein